MQFGEMNLERHRGPHDVFRSWLGRFEDSKNVLGGCSVLSAGCELGGIGLTDLILNSLLELLGDWQVILISSRNQYMNKLEHESGWLPSCSQIPLLPRTCFPLPALPHCDQDTYMFKY